MSALGRFLLVCLTCFSLWAAPVTPTRRNGPSDVELERAIRAKLAKSKISADGFQVHVVNGVATFEGRTNVVQHKGVATRLAHSAGVMQVNNKIQISDAAKQKLLTQLQKGQAAKLKAPVAQVKH